MQQIKTTHNLKWLKMKMFTAKLSTHIHIIRQAPGQDAQSLRQLNTMPKPRVIVGVFWLLVIV